MANLYDASGAPLGMQYRTANTASSVWQTYWYERDLLNSIVAVYNHNGSKLVSYTYDAWGNFTTTYHNGGASTKAADNPFTYRGYYYDKDLDLYRLGTRYYDARMGRFINSDSIIDKSNINGLNLYSYCGNDPINRYDPTGCFFDYILDAVLITLGVIDFVEDPSWEKGALLAVDIALAVVPFIPALSGARHLSKADDVVDAVKAADKVDDVVDGMKTAKKIHGNSLDTPKETIGYALIKKDTGEIMKFGETTRGVKRYTNKFYTDNGVKMNIIARGSKREMHFWQHNQILDYTKKYGHRPPWNKSNW